MNSQKRRNSASKSTSLQSSVFNILFGSHSLLFTSPRDYTNQSRTGRRHQGWGTKSTIGWKSSYISGLDTSILVPRWDTIDLELIHSRKQCLNRDYYRVKTKGQELLCGYKLGEYKSRYLRQLLISHNLSIYLLVPNTTYRRPLLRFGQYYQISHLSHIHSVRKKISIY